jgi:hypothetical protein
MSSSSMTMPMRSAPTPMMEYEEIESDGGAIEPFEQNDPLQASY